MAVKRPRPRRPVGLHLHSQAARVSHLIDGNVDRNGIFHDLDAASVHHPKLHGLARRFELLRLFDVAPVDQKNHVIVAKARAIKRRARLRIVYAQSHPIGILPARPRKCGQRREEKNRQQLLGPSRIRHVMRHHQNEEDQRNLAHSFPARNRQGREQCR